MFKRLMLVALTAGLVGAQLTADAFCASCHRMRKHATHKAVVKKAVKKAVRKHAVKKVRINVSYVWRSPVFRQALGPALRNRVVKGVVVYSHLPRLARADLQTLMFKILCYDNKFRRMVAQKRFVHVPLISACQSQKNPVPAEVICGPCTLKGMWFNKATLDSLVRLVHRKI